MTSYHNSLSPLFANGVLGCLLVDYEGVGSWGLVDGVLVLGFGSEVPLSFCCALRVEAIGDGAWGGWLPS